MNNYCREEVGAEPLCRTVAGRELELRDCKELLQRRS
jgi:hypothetical protein